MFHDAKAQIPDADTLAQMGSDALAYMREITTEEIEDKFPGIPDLEKGVTYWAMFAADGTPLMLAGNRKELINSAYFNDLTAILPN